MLLATGSNYWHSGLPALLPIPEEGSAKPTGEQPSTSSDIPSGDYGCRLEGQKLKLDFSLNGKLQSTAFCYNPNTKNNKQDLQMCEYPPAYRSHLRI